ncbi:DUF397 domain-containing protein [Streptomyces sp. NPDC000348]|uniref:DUF397 domain-containing protein n=1 Tax=Streptomyces sp. NPDC000348 TaxID=3364538 RepID=UPI00368937A3
MTPRPSSYSGNEAGRRLEVVDDHRAGAAVRDLKAADGPAVVSSVAGWMPFVAALRN